MWRLGEQLAGQCLHVGQEVSFIGAVVARVDAIYIRGGECVSVLSFLTCAVDSRWNRCLAG